MEVEVDADKYQKGVDKDAKEKEWIDDNGYNSKGESRLIKTAQGLRN